MHTHLAHRIHGASELLLLCQQTLAGRVERRSLGPHGGVLGADGVEQQERAAHFLQKIHALTFFYFFILTFFYEQKMVAEGTRVCGDGGGKGRRIEIEKEKDVDTHD